MTWAIPNILLIGVLGALLVSAGIEDVRRREIANWKNAAIALLAPLWWLATGLAPWPDMVVQIGVAMAVFALYCVAFYFGQMGGGDVKLIGALALWLPPIPLLWMLVSMSLLGGLLTLAMVIDHRLAKNRPPLEIPYGVAIAIAGLLAFGEPVLNHFA